MSKGEFALSHHSGQQTAHRTISEHSGLNNISEHSGLNNISEHSGLNTPRFFWLDEANLFRGYFSPRVVRSLLVSAFVSGLFGMAPLSSAFAQQETGIASDQQGIEACKGALETLRGMRLHKGSSADQVQTYERALSKCPELTEGYYNLGVVFFEKQDLDKAKGYFEKALSLEERASYKIGLAHVLLEEGNTAGATGVFKEVLAKDARSHSALFGLGLIAYQQEDFEGAKGYFERAIEADASDGASRFNLGRTYHQLGNFGKAVEQLFEVLERNPGDTQAMQELGIVYLEIGNAQQAVRYLKQAQDRGAKDSETLHALGVAYERLRRYEKAEQVLREARALDPDNSALNLNLAVVLVEQEQADEALSLIDKVELDAASEAKVQSVRGWALTSLGRYQEAEEQLLQALESDENNAVAHHNLGVVFERTDRADLAAQEFEQSKRLDPKLAKASGMSSETVVR